MVARLLEGRAQTWWERLEDKYHGNITWSDFEEEFHLSFHTEHYIEKKRQEFVALRQGPMTVYEYENKLRELAEFAPDLFNTEKQKCLKLERGLRLEIREKVTLPKEPDYHYILD